MIAAGTARLGTGAAVDDSVIAVSQTSLHLPDRAFRPLIGAVESALRSPQPPPCDAQPCCSSRRATIDTVDCGLLLNEGRREIHRLRSGLDRDLPVRSATVAFDRKSIALSAPRSCDATASLPSDRRPYAVAPLGAMPESRRDQPPPIVPAMVRRVGVVTNLGTLLDVLI